MEMLGMIMMPIVNPRVGWNMEEVARLVAAFRLIFSILVLCHSGNLICLRDTDGGEGLAMAGWKGEQDTVDNQVKFTSFNTFFILIVIDISGRFRRLRTSMQPCMGTRRTQRRTPSPSPTSLTWRQVASLPAATRFERDAFPK